ncbi:MAG TPA: SRPBCC domain-containing protein [Candidatus Limnocylindria bacterium]|nr:SRPBCC domain-containing protein [Candidatus Limnocylindria bacterium]
MSNPAPRDVSRGRERIALEIELPVAPELAHACWTDPELVAGWWAPSTHYAADGAYRYSWPEQDWHLSGRVLRAAPGRRLRLSWRWEHEPDRPERELDLRFGPSGAGTLLHLEHGPYGDGPGEADERAEHLEGWLHFLPRLAAAAAASGRRG